MRLVVASVAMVLGVAMLLPSANAPTAFAQDASVDPIASVEPAGSALPDAFVELVVDEGDPALEWDIAVTGGSPSLDHLTLQDIGPSGFYGAFTVAVVGQSATVEMTTALPPRWELSMVGCLDDLDPPTEINPVVSSRGFVLEVVPGRRYSCLPFSFDLDGTAPTAPPEATLPVREPTVAPTELTLPRTETLPGAPPGPSSGVPMVFVVLAGVIAGSLLVGVRARR